MDSRAHLRRLDELEVPELWTDIQMRHPRPQTEAPIGPLRRLVIVMAALSIGAAGALLASNALSDGGTDIGPRQPELSGNGRFALERDGDIVLVEPHTGDLANITQTRNIYEFQPAWSPNGQEIVFVGCRECTEPDLYIMNADGSERRQITSGPDAELNPRWSPDGRMIVFQRGTADAATLWTLTLATGHEVELPRFAPYGFSGVPSWSPDGSAIVFEVSDSFESRIAVMRADGSGQRLLTGDSVHASSPAWSPDGTLIAFGVMDDRGHTSLFTMSPSGTGVRKIAQGGSFAWAPDARSIAILRGADGDAGESVVVTVARDGTEEREIATFTPSGDGYVKSLAWQPLP